MRWDRFTIETVTEAEDLVAATLAELGIQGVEICDRQPLTKEECAQMFVDILPEGPQDDGIAYLNFYLDEEEDTDGILERVRQALEELKSFTDIGSGAITRSQTEDKDWINNWKEYFHQFYVDDILITPSWEPVKSKDQGKLLIQIDPGTAFGTGMHETTQLCIRQIKKYVTEETVLLDVGTGSGILSIAALKLGAKRALGTDLDPCAISASKENMEVNGIPAEKFRVLEGNLIDDGRIQEQVGCEQYDMVTANILAEVLVPLTPVIVQHLKEGGIYITSGIIEEKETVVADAVRETGLEILEVTHQGEWVSVTARKN